LPDELFAIPDEDPEPEPIADLSDIPDDEGAAEVARLIERTIGLDSSSDVNREFAWISPETYDEVLKKCFSEVTEVRSGLSVTYVCKKGG